MAANEAVSLGHGGFRWCGAPVACRARRSPKVLAKSKEGAGRWWAACVGPGRDASPSRSPISLELHEPRNLNLASFAPSGFSLQAGKLDFPAVDILQSEIGRELSVIFRFQVRLHGPGGREALPNGDGTFQAAMREHSRWRESQEAQAGSKGCRCGPGPPLVDPASPAMQLLETRKSCGCGWLTLSTRIQCGHALVYPGAELC